jgi:SAM-dependent methyltransferase
MFGIYTRVLRYSKSVTDYCRYKFYATYRQGKFVFQNEEYDYLIHPYNYTWRNERIVEIPIIKKIIEKNSGKRILELGNVTSHYFNVNHTILDKYEKAVGVINKDVVDYKTTKKYDLIVSISTLEHVGWDENGDYKKILKAISNLKKLLSKNGQIIFTHPLGYNFFMDEFLRKGKIKISKAYLMQRVSKENEWKEIPWKKQLLRYHYPYSYANGVLIGIIKK